MLQKPDVNFNPLVSIIVTNYNYGHFLASAIESALHQQYPAIEVIVVDDGSTDNSRYVIDCYGERILPIFKQNGGQGSAINAGFSQSHGEIVIFLDADDMLLPNIVQRIVDAYRVNPEASKIMYRLEVVDADGKRIGELRPQTHLPLQSGFLQKHVLTFPFDMVWMATSGNSFAASVLRQILPMPEKEYPILADYYLSLLTPLLGPVVFLHDVGAYYRLHGRNNHENSHRIDLQKIRRVLTYSNTTWDYIQKFAEKLELEGYPASGSQLLSVSLISERFISLKLSPDDHPVPEDTTWRLFRLGIAASLRRFDVSWPMKILYILWFTAMLPAPKPVAHWLAGIFSFPEKRQFLNRFLGALHRAVKQ
jgi:glycosyltransferase involved in cell wall biosynthesis